jgi:hypothetical protein
MNTPTGQAQQLTAASVTTGQDASGRATAANGRKAARSPAARRALPDLLGVAMRSEAWVLLSQDMTPGQRSRAAAGHLTRVSLEPNRVEARVIHGIDTAGTDYHFHQPRGGKLVTFIRQPGGEAADLGEVPEALRCLLDAMTSRQPQPQDPER